MGSTVFATVSTPGPAGPQGIPGYSPQYIVAAGAPAAGVGNNGDMYINSSTSDVYGPKTSGAWGGIKCNIKGTTGTTGATGAPGYSPQYIVAAGAPAAGVGNNGDMYINSSTSDVYGPKTAGSWGSIQCNIKGTTGTTGVQGPPGVAYTPRGPWSSASVAYVLGDEVSDAGQVWICLVNHTSSAGNRPSTPTPATWQAVGSGASQTPWLSDINGGTFQLTNTGGVSLTKAYAETPTKLYQSNGNGILQLQAHLSSGQEWPFQIGMADSTGSLYFSTSSGVTPPTAPTFTERMRITNGGNVGVGHSAPSVKFVTLGTAADPSLTVNQEIVQVAAGTGVTLAMGVGSSISASWIQSKWLNAGSGSSFPLLLNPAGANVGVGKWMAPSHTLHVNNLAPLGTAVSSTLLVFRLQVDASGVGQDDNIVFQSSRSAAGSDWNTSEWRIQRQVQASPMAWIGFPSQELTIGTAGVERVRVSVGGNVGIGLSNPSAKLHVASTPAGTATLLAQFSGYRSFTLANDGLMVGLTSSNGALGTHDFGAIFAGADPAVNNGGYGVMEFRVGGNATAQLSINSAAAFLQAHGNGTYVDAVYLRTNNIVRLAVDVNGNVGIGIGTAAPSGPLEVQGGTANARLNVTLLNNAASGASSRMRLRLGSWAGFNATDLYPYMEAINESTIGDQVGLAFGTYSGGSLGERLRITAAGDLTSSYSFRTTAKRNVFGIAGGGPTALLNTDANVILYDNGSGNWAGIGAEASGMMWFRTGLSGAGDAAVVIDNTGKVGIKKTAPGFALDVTGDVNCTGAFKIGGVAIGGGGITTRDRSTGTTPNITRAMATPYQNTSGKPKLVTVSVLIAASNVLNFSTDAASSPTILVASASSGTGAALIASVTAWVMPGDWYRIDSPSGILQSWNEWY